MFESAALAVLLFVSGTATLAHGVPNSTHPSHEHTGHANTRHTVISAAQRKAMKEQHCEVKERLEGTMSDRWYVQCGHAL